MAISLPGLLCLMDTKIVHKDSYRFLSVAKSQPVQELDEFISIEGLILDSQGFHSYSLRDSSTNANVAYIHLHLVNADIAAFSAPFLFANTKLSKVDLI